MSNQFSDVPVKRESSDLRPASDDSCHVISILPLMSAGIVSSHLSAQCVSTLEEIVHGGAGGHATWNHLYNCKWICVGLQGDGWHLLRA